MADCNRQQRIDEVFCEACEVPKSQLDDFLAKACGDDLEIRNQVERLLAADQELQSDEQILADPPFEGIVDEIHEAAEQALGEANEIKAAAADRNLLFGVVALQMNFINRNALIQAMNAWVLNKTKPIESILISQGDMGENTNLLLTALVDKHLEHHNNNPQKSLASLNADGELKEELNVIDDQELDQSIVHLDSDSTPSFPDVPTVAFGDSSKRGGRFRVLRPHKEGGLGAVSVAKDEELNREVALKEVLKKYVKNKSARDRLRVEAEITGGLEHPGIVPVYGLGSYDDGSPFYCMRFIKGDSLKDAIKRFQKSKASMSASERNLELRNLLRRFADVCDAISYAHSRSVLHRDLKPGNIMLGKYGETLVVDWGLAKATGQDQEVSASADRPIIPRSGSTAAPTMAGSTIGTPQYMSPEQAEGRIDQLGPATDVYSLGATLYCLLTGQAAFTDRKPEEVLRKVRNSEFPRPTAIESTVPKALEAICLKAMEKETNLRYSSPVDLGMDIERWLADEPVTAYADPWLSRAARLIRKNRTAAATIGVATMVAFVGLIGMNLISRSKNLEIQGKNNEINTQNDELIAVNNKLFESRDKTNRSYRSFRTLTTELIQKAEGDLSQTPEMENVREWLTRQTLEMFRQFRDENPDSERFTDSVNSRIWMSRLHRYEANVNRNGNQLDKSIDNYRFATSILRDVVDKNSESAQAVGLLSETLRDYANTVGRTGKLVESGQLSEESVKLSEQLLAKYPNSLNCKRLKATNLLDSAGISEDLGNLDKSLAYSESSIQLFAPIVDGNHVEDGDLRLLLLAFLRQSSSLRQLSKFEEARVSVNEAIRRSRDNLRENKQRGDRHILARSLLEKVQVEKEIEESESKVDEMIAESIKIWEELNLQYPDFSAYEQYLAVALMEYGHVLSDKKGTDQAVVQYEQALSKSKSLASKDKNDFVSLEILGDVCINYSKHEYRNGNRQHSLELAEEALANFEIATNFKPKSKALSRQLEKTREFINNFVDE